MSTEFYESPSRGYQPEQHSPQWGDVIYGPQGQAMRSCRADYNCDPGMVVDTGNWNGDPGMIIRPSQAQMDMDPGIYMRAGYNAHNYNGYDFNRGYDPRLNPNQLYGNNGVNVRLDLGPVSLNLGNGRHSWMNYDTFNGNHRGDAVYRDRYGRPYQPDNYGWGNGSQWGRDYGRGQWDSYDRGQWDRHDRYDGYNDRWNDNYRSQQMQRMAFQMIMQLLQRQRQGQWGYHDPYGRDQYGRGQWGRDQYGRDQYDQYGRDPYGRDQHGRRPYVVRDPYGRDQYGYGRDQYGQYNDRSWQQGRDQYGRPYDLDQYGWGQNGRDRYGRDQYGRYDQYGRDQYDRYGRDQYERYGRDRQYGRDPYWNQLAGTIERMLGCSVRQFNRNVPENLGCATFVSAALRHSFNVNIHDTSVRGLEQSLRKNGFEQVDLRDLRPGDIIIGNRHSGKPGHAAIYAGDGQVAQNSSSKRRIVLEDADVFKSRSFQRVVAYRPRV